MLQSGPRSPNHNTLYRYVVLGIKTRKFIRVNIVSLSYYYWYILKVISTFLTCNFEKTINKIYTVSIYYYHFEKILTVISTVSMWYHMINEIYTNRYANILCNMSVHRRASKRVSSLKSSPHFVKSLFYFYFLT